MPLFIRIVRSRQTCRMCRRYNPGTPESCAVDMADGVNEICSQCSQIELGPQSPACQGSGLRPGGCGGSMVEMGTEDLEPGFCTVLVQTQSLAGYCVLEVLPANFRVQGPSLTHEQATALPYPSTKRWAAGFSWDLSGQMTSCRSRLGNLLDFHPGAGPLLSSPILKSQTS